MQEAPVQVQQPFQLVRVSNFNELSTKIEKFLKLCLTDISRNQSPLMERLNAAVEASNGDETTIVLDLSINGPSDAKFENEPPDSNLQDEPPDANLHNGEENVEHVEAEQKNETPIVTEMQPKRRKKPRKQNLNSPNVRPSANMQFEDQNMENVEDTFVHTMRKHHRESEEEVVESEVPKSPTSSYIRNQPHMYMLKR